MSKRKITVTIVAVLIAILMCIPGFTLRFWIFVTALGCYDSPKKAFTCEYKRVYDHRAEEFMFGPVYEVTHDALEDRDTGCVFMTWRVVRFGPLNLYAWWPGEA